MLAHRPCTLFFRLPYCTHVFSQYSLYFKTYSIPGISVVWFSLLCADSIRVLVFPPAAAFISFCFALICAAKCGNPIMQLLWLWLYRTVWQRLAFCARVENVRRPSFPIRCNSFLVINYGQKWKQLHRIHRCDLNAWQKKIAMVWRVEKFKSFGQESFE